MGMGREEIKTNYTIVPAPLGIEIKTNDMWLEYEGAWGGNVSKQSVYVFESQNDHDSSKDARMYILALVPQLSGVTGSKTERHFGQQTAIGLQVH